MLDTLAEAIAEKLLTGCGEQHELVRREFGQLAEQPDGVNGSARARESRGGIEENPHQKEASE